MGNETSSVKIHALLSAEDIKHLRANFPGGGNGPSPTRLNWESWKVLWSTEFIFKFERILIKDLPESEKGEGSAKGITFHDYQDIAGNVVRGTAEDRTKLIFGLLNVSLDRTVRASEFLEFVTDVCSAAGKLPILRNMEESGKQLYSQASIEHSDPSCRILAQSLIHDIVFPTDQAKKACLYKTPEQDVALSFDAIERWMVMKCPLFDEIYLAALARSFGLPVVDPAARRPPLFPLEGIRIRMNTALSPHELAFLNYSLPSADLRFKWRKLFNSREHGENFSKLSSAIQNQGPTLVIVWEENGNILGGFASDSWRLSPKFMGNNTCFLFTLSPRMYVYESTPFNENYQYLNMKQKTLPNGLGMGGQFDYFGLWLDAEYGKARCAPTCSTFHSPQLSKEEYFHYTHCEVWGVGDEPNKEDEDQVSVLDRDPEAVAVMEMMGKTFVSKDVRAADEQE